MTGEDVPHAIFLALMLLLPTSALVARRLDWKTNVRMALGWIAIFAVILLLVIERDRFAAVGRDVRHAFDPEAGERHGQAMHVPMSDDGHFWVRADVNGASVRFLIDSGATTTALGPEAAAVAHVAASTGLISGIEVPVDTANGTVMARRATVDRLAIGSIERRQMSVFVADSFGATNVLGMNFLSSLSGWRVQGRTLILEP